MLLITTSQGLQAAGDSAVPTVQHLHGRSLCDLVREKVDSQCPSIPESVLRTTGGNKMFSHGCDSVSEEHCDRLGGFHSYMSLQKARVVCKSDMN